MNRVRSFLLGMAVALLPAFPVRGADDAKPAHWAFQPVRDPALPAVRHADWCRNGIDRFVLARLEAAGQQPAPAAGRRGLIRRVTLDLTGLPPTADETDAFVADTAPDAYARLVDRLLDSPHYGEHWGRHWLDVVRYADTAGETADYPVPVAWRYRNYVIDAFNADKPYDEFLREQIAGDILAARGPRERYAERVTATGYLAISRRFGFDSENYHHLTIQDTIDTLGQSVLGLSLGCARCHAHKFDPVSTADYYGLYGIFESTRYAFPGSEQKQRLRSMAPVIPPEESVPRWREFEARAAVLAKQLERQGRSAPSAVLRSLADFDGDFELQAPASGGSKGVLVPPWIYEGQIAITTDAQSPYRNLHPGGRVGASVPAGTNDYRIVQSIHPRWSPSGGAVLHANLDVRVATNDSAATGKHRFWLGSLSSGPAFEVLLGSGSVAIRVGDRVTTPRALRPGQWHNLQFAIDPKARAVSGRVGLPGDVVEFAAIPLAAGWTGTIDAVGFDASGPDAGMRPAAAFDNLGVQEAPIAPVATTSPVLAGLRGESEAEKLNGELRALAGHDGDFELQADGAPPASPWGPGPNSVVKVLARAQSPYGNIYPAGRLGIHMPNTEAYNGLGLTLTNRWQADRTGALHAGFDFRLAGVEAGGGGSWRFYLGHGAGGSAAVEVAFNGSEFFRRSGAARDPVRKLKVGTWYQVQLDLDLKAKHYTGSIAAPDGRTEFEGRFADGWDGSIDYSFVDSYGHLPGPRPALDADNFVVGEMPLPPFGSAAVAETEARRATRTAAIAGVRRQLALGAAAADKARLELETLLAEGPFPLTYAVAEGTPHDARIQKRGEPDQPGDRVPRGFIQALGGGKLAKDTAGSGRLELAEWLTRPTNPLTARVMANRIWQYHFGKGLVRTPNDFGVRGQAPSHPELLDHLATQFMRGGWSVKAMHRMILASAAYQQGSLHPVAGSVFPEAGASEDCPVVPTAAGRREAAMAVGGDLFAPFLRRRLGAEETRDAILFASGALDPSVGQAHAFPSPTGWGYTQHGPFGAVYEHNRRSVYLMTQRIRRHPFLALFDGPDPNASTAERRVTTVPTQALYFLNDPFVHANAEKLAARAMAAGGDAARHVVAAYRFALGRDPDARERAEAAEFLAAYGRELAAAGKPEAERGALAAFARVLFGTNEFLTAD